MTSVRHTKRACRHFPHGSTGHQHAVPMTRLRESELNFIFDASNRELAGTTWGTL